MKKTFLYLLAILLTALLLFVDTSAQDFTIKKWVVTSGGSVNLQNEDGESLSGASGQFAIEKLSLSNEKFDVYQGFWVPDPIDEGTSVKEPNMEISVNPLKNYPNPFSHSTEIRCELQRSGYLTLKIYDVMGNLVKTLYEGMHSAGTFSVNWDARDNSGRDVSSGSYVYELSVRPGQLSGAPSFDRYSLRNIMVVVK